MKSLISLVTLTLSLGAFAQERIELNSKKETVNSDRAILVRTAQTPNKVELEFYVTLKHNRCRYEDQYVSRTCYRTENVYRTQRVCENKPVATPTPSSTPRGPRYNPPTTRVCRDVRVHAGTRSYPYNCSYYQSVCVSTYQVEVPAKDKVKIKFNLPALGGTEEETFLVTANQRREDSNNVEYTIVPTSDAQRVIKKGILGYDSYVIEMK